MLPNHYNRKMKYIAVFKFKDIIFKHILYLAYFFQIMKHIFHFNIFFPPDISFTFRENYNITYYIW